jgi:hypothetical protein
MFLMDPLVEPSHCEKPTSLPDELYTRPMKYGGLYPE